VKVVSQKLTTALTLVMDPINEEVEYALPMILPATKEWKSTKWVKNGMLLVTEASSRVFLGLPLCRTPKWLEIARDYTVDLMMAAYAMRAVPPTIRPFTYWALPPVKKLQRTVSEAEKIIRPEVQRRRKARAEALARGDKIPKHLDSIDWIDELASSDYDFVGGQLALTFVSIHTTSNAMILALYDLIEHPEHMEELRREIITIFKEDGTLKKTTLHKMKFFDSFMKESQRVNVQETRKSCLCPS
jgi:cytochrome P450